MNSAVLVLQDGTVLKGTACGAAADAVFELVFNTSMSGYQEILTDPSYRGQGVLFTATHIGNVGINLEDDESLRPQISAMVTRAISPVVSNWRAQIPLSQWLEMYQVPGISGVDTRWLARKLRDGGTQKAAISTQGTAPDELLQRCRDWSGLDGLDMVAEASCAEPYHWQDDLGAKWVPDHREPGKRCHIVAYDYGIKENILRHLSSYGADITVVPAKTSAADALALKPDGVFLSNGPGDPEGLPYAVESTAALIDSGVPLFGICLGHQLIGMALGGEKLRLKFGHHSGNHPVRDERSGKISITAQNHNYCIAADSLNPDEVEVTHLSLNDGSLEGLRMRRKPVFSVQYHPEAAPGPHDAHSLFSDFFKLVYHA
ncbi:MAG TPA: glutamine-hydrolyzing carbamoyl-phosphate synthase small subunit [Bellilinea sp.]|nr:glutamine-hydrolyzing carbamoyl-phosphate synthase small subunit [Bellilinea sp.]